jgi:hypothetical protein
MIPTARIRKSDGNTGAVKRTTQGVLAILAPSSSGTLLLAGTFSRQADLVAAVGIGALPELGAYHMLNAKKPVLAIKTAASVAATTSAVTFVGTGTSIVTESGTPVDEYEVLVQVLNGGTIGVAGITYRYSLDNGQIWSGVKALGTANTVAALTVPRLNVSSGIGFALAAGTLVTGDSFSCTTKGPQMNAADLLDALEALRVTRLPWEGVLVHGDVTATMVSELDSWLAAREAEGKYRMGWVNTRHKTRPVPSGETEAAFATAMGTLRGTIANTIRIDCGVDGGDVVSPITGLSQARPTALAIASRALSIDVGTDPAWIALGPIPGFKLTDLNGNPKWHDEVNYPGLDDMGFSALRSVNDEDGVFINNANLLSGSGSDYVYDQHARTMNAACEFCQADLQKHLSRGVRKQKPDPTTNAIYILEADASAIDTITTAGTRKILKGQVTDAAFLLSRTDDISANTGATITGEVQVESLAYIKDFDITSKFVRSVSVTL